MVNYKKYSVGGFELKEPDYNWLWCLFQFFKEADITFEIFVSCILLQPSSWMEDEQEARIIDGHLVFIDFAFIDSLACHTENNLTQFDESQNIKNKIKTLDFGDLPRLNKVFIDGNYFYRVSDFWQIKNLDFSKNIYLEELKLLNTDIAKLDLSNQDSLKKLTVQNLQKIKLSNHAQLELLHSDLKIFNQLDLKNLADLKSLFLYTALNKFNLPHFANLEILVIRDSWLFDQASECIDIDIINQPKIESVRLKGRIRANIQNLPELKRLNFHGEVEQLSLQNIPKLEIVSLRNTKDLKFLNGHKIIYLYLVGDCGDLGSLPLDSLESLSIDGGDAFKISHLNLKGFNNLKFFSLTSLPDSTDLNIDLSDKKCLDHIYLENVSINILDISNLKNLNTIYIINSKIKTLICSSELKNSLNSFVDQIENMVIRNLN